MKRRPRPAAIAVLAGLTATMVPWPRAGVATAVSCGALLFVGARRAATVVTITTVIVVLLIGPPTRIDRHRALPIRHAEASHAR